MSFKHKQFPFHGRRKSPKRETSLQPHHEDAIRLALEDGVPRDKVAAKLGLTKSLVDEYFHSLTSTKQTISTSTSVDTSSGDALESSNQ